VLLLEGEQLRVDNGRILFERVVVLVGVALQPELAPVLLEKEDVRLTAAPNETTTRLDVSVSLLYGVPNLTTFNLSSIAVSLTVSSSLQAWYGQCAFAALATSSISLSFITLPSTVGPPALGSFVC
jgi:hypothetical protein